MSYDRYDRLMLSHSTIVRDEESPRVNYIEDFYRTKMEKRIEKTGKYKLSPLEKKIARIKSLDLKEKMHIIGHLRTERKDLIGKWDKKHVKYVVVRGHKRKYHHRKYVTVNHYRTIHYVHQDRGTIYRKKTRSYVPYLSHRMVKLPKWLFA